MFQIIPPSFPPKRWWSLPNGTGLVEEKYRHCTCADLASFFQRRSNFDNVFFLILFFLFKVDKGIENPNNAINEP